MTPIENCGINLAREAHPKIVDQSSGCQQLISKRKRQTESLNNLLAPAKQLRITHKPLEGLCEAM
jgi:hypothetical protein